MSETKTTTLAELVEEYGANAFVLADAGNGCGYGEDGQLAMYDEAAADEYGETEMLELSEPHMSDDGQECTYASEWIEQGEGDNPYRVRLFF